MLHPTIEFSVTPTSRIADVATGTGALLIDLSKQLPKSCQLDGFDLSDSQFPSKDDLPENITFHIADAKALVESQFKEKFDIVNIRYLTAGLKPDDWEVVARNAYDMLKPGGWLQWLEADLPAALHFCRLDPTAPNSTQELLDRIYSTIVHFGYGSKELYHILPRVGFESVVQEKTSSDRFPETRPGWTKIYWSPVYNLLVATEKKKGPDGYSSEQCLDLMERIRAEQSAGITYSRFDLDLFISRKPL